jgi:serine/threonine-protein kinase RsbW
MVDAEPHRDLVRLDVPNEPKAIDKAQAQVVDALEREGYPKASLFAVRLAMHEAITNAFVHGHRELGGDMPVHIEYRVGPAETEITIEDQGPGFDPAAIPDPTLDENLERGSGRGLLLIRAYMSVAEYNAKGNMLRMVYKRPG